MTEPQRVQTPSESLAPEAKSAALLAALGTFIRSARLGGLRTVAFVAPHDLQQTLQGFASWMVESGHLADDHRQAFLDLVAEAAQPMARFAGTEAHDVLSGVLAAC